MRRSARHFLLPALALIALAGCGSSPTEPSKADMLERLFTADEAEILASGADITVRLLDPEFTGSDPTGLSAGLMATLDKFRDVFPEFPDASVSVEAHRDERGSDAYNERITEIQASNVLGYLIEECEAPTAGASARGYGEERPLDPGSSEAAWQRNRRVEVILRGGAAED